MATIFLDQFSGSGNINAHTPDIPAPGNADDPVGWLDDRFDIIGEPAAVVSGGFLIAGPNFQYGDALSVKYKSTASPFLYNDIGFPASTTTVFEVETTGAENLPQNSSSFEILLALGCVYEFFEGEASFVAAIQDSAFSIQVNGSPRPFTFAPNTPYQIKLVLEPGVFRVYINDVFIESSNNPNFANLRGIRVQPSPAFRINSIEVLDTVPPVPTDYLFDNFTGDGPMEGRTPDLVAIPGVVWTDTSPTGNAETLDGNMVAGPGVPTDGVASARYGDFSEPYYGPLTGDIYSEFSIGPDLVYPAGATGPVTLVGFRFSQSPGTSTLLAVVLNPDGSSSVLYGDGLTAPITLTPNDTYSLYINYLENEHSVSLFDFGLGGSIFSDSYAYTPTDPTAGYGATELYVNERASITYYEVYGLPQAPPGPIVNDTDGLDEGVAEDTTDTLNTATEDVAEAGVGDDYPLPDGEVRPEDVREAGLAADMADTMLNANQVARDAGVGADIVPFSIASTFFRDEFTGTGGIAGHVPEQGFGPAAWTGESILSGGLLRFDPSQILFTSASYGSESTNFGTRNSGQISFRVITKTIPANQDTNIFGLRFSVRGRLVTISLQRLASGFDQVRIDGIGSAIASARVSPNTTYNASVQYTGSGIFVTGLGGAVSLNWNETSPVGLNELRFFNYPSADIDRIEVTRALANIEVEDAYDSGFAVDAATPFLLVDVREAGVAEDVANPMGGRRLFFADGADTGISGDATDVTTTINANGLAAGVATDSAPNSYYALPREDGVAADATSTTLNANQIALDAGIADATTDTRILEDVVATGVAADTTSLAVSLTASDEGVATDLALSGATIAADVREAGVAVDEALPLSFVDVREAGVAADVVTDQRQTNQAARSDGVAEDTTDPRLNAGALAVAAGVAADATSTQLVAYSMVIEAGVGDDAGLFGRLYEAWVMNTQNTAMSRYTSLPFNSAAVIGGRVIGLGDGGFFELGGTTDAGKPIMALMKSGHLTLQADNIKRLDDMTVGYTSTGTLQLTVAAYGGPLKGRWTYTAPPVDAVSPRGNRVTLGRGLQAKYYQFTIENTKGAAMSIDFARVISNEFKSRRF